LLSDEKLLRHGLRLTAVEVSLIYLNFSYNSCTFSCQTYEGGFGGVRCCEAHGGYTFCGVAALMILGKFTLMHAPSLYKWLAQKQMKYEGGFQGRTNKLVDGCYSFWQAAVFPMLEVVKSTTIHPSFDAKALQEYILIACQDVESGGLRDKPHKFVSFEGVLGNVHRAFDFKSLS
uniref:Protein farnesyltransferase subunit beta n=1 Tax=Gongylonema pulchrum TaxID=637853 RepID=A0A183EZ76_9BILA